MLLVSRWEYDESYCDAVKKTSPYDSGPRLLDIIDTAVFDYLIGNADRHHYESFQDDEGASMLILLDNAKRWDQQDCPCQGGVSVYERRAFSRASWRTSRIQLIGGVLLFSTWSLCCWYLSFSLLSGISVLQKMEKQFFPRSLRLYEPLLRQLETRVIHLLLPTSFLAMIFGV